MDKLRDGPGRLTAELDELSRGRLDERRDSRADPQAGNGEVARRARAHVHAGQHEQRVRAAAKGQPDEHIPVLSCEQQRRLLPATAERLMGRGRQDRPVAAAGRQTG